MSKNNLLDSTKCMENSRSEKYENRLFIPSPYAELIEKIADEQNTTVDDIAEKAIRDFLETSETNARK